MLSKSTKRAARTCDVGMSCAIDSSTRSQREAEPPGRRPAEARAILPDWPAGTPLPPPNVETPRGASPSEPPWPNRETPHGASLHWEGRIRVKEARNILQASVVRAVEGREFRCTQLLR